MAVIAIRVEIKLDEVPGECYNAESWLRIMRSSSTIPDWYKAGEPTLIDEPHEYSPDLMAFASDDPNEWVDRCRICLRDHSEEDKREFRAKARSYMDEGIEPVIPDLDAHSGILMLDPKPTMDGAGDNCLLRLSVSSYSTNRTGVRDPRRCLVPITSE